MSSHAKQSVLCGAVSIATNERPQQCTRDYSEGSGSAMAAGAGCGGAAAWVHWFVFL